jgi:hypothetical protein
MQSQPFTPDHDYCVYCHAPAAGPCADCGALCCGDCVEVVQRITSRRAVCRPCVAAELVPARRRLWPWVTLATAAIVGLLWSLGR